MPPRGAVIAETTFHWAGTWRATAATHHGGALGPPVSQLTIWP